MSGPTREEVDRVADMIADLHRVADAMTVNDLRSLASGAANRLSTLASENAALRERLEAAEARSYALAVAIMGGEDAPGYADSVPTQVLVDQQRKMAAEWVHAVPADESRAREAAAWEAGRDAMHVQSGYKSVVEVLPPDDLAAALTARLDAARDEGWNAAIEAAADAKGYEYLVERAAIRALRREKEGV